MKLSIGTDLTAAAGLAIVGAGLYQFSPALSAIYAGLLLVAAAVLVARRQAATEKNNSEV